MATPSDILGDPNFHALPSEEKRKVMLAVDPRGFGALNPGEQDKVFSLSAQRSGGSEANRALAWTGLSVSQPKAPLPAELGGPSKPTENTPWYLGGRAADAVDDALAQGSDQMWNGAATMTDPAMERKAKGASRIVRGALTAASPAIVPAVAANPVGALVRTGAGMLTQGAVEGGAKALNVPEGYANLAGDIAGLAVASRDGAGLRRAAGIARRVATNPDAYKAAGDIASNVNIVKPLQVVTRGIPQAAERLGPILQKAKSEQSAAEHRAGPPPAPAWQEEQGGAPPEWDWQTKLSATQPSHTPPAPPELTPAEMARQHLAANLERRRTGVPSGVSPTAITTALREAQTPFTAAEQALADHVMAGTEPPTPPADVAPPAFSQPEGFTSPGSQMPTMPEAHPKPPIVRGPGGRMENSLQAIGAAEQLRGSVGMPAEPVRPVAKTKPPIPETKPAAGETMPPMPETPAAQTPTSAFESAFESPETMAPNGKPTKESVIAGHRTVKGRAIARLLRDRNVSAEKASTWKLGGPELAKAAKSAGVNAPTSAESLAVVLDELRKMPARDVPEFAKGGVVAPKRKPRGRFSRRGIWYGPAGSMPPEPRK